MPKILIVEDDRATRELLRQILTRGGYDVIDAADGARGVGMARAQQPDLVIMDMGLPVLNGWQATHRLKTRPETRHIPVIALTAYAFAEDRARALNAGCDDYDVKPIDQPRLLEKIAVLLAQGVTSREV